MLWNSRTCMIEKLWSYTNEVTGMKWLVWGDFGVKCHMMRCPLVWSDWYKVTFFPFGMKWLKKWSDWVPQITRKKRNLMTCLGWSQSIIFRWQVLDFQMWDILSGRNYYGSILRNRQDLTQLIGDRNKNFWKDPLKWFCRK